MEIGGGWTEPAVERPRVARRRLATAIRVGSRITGGSVVDPERVRRPRLRRRGSSEAAATRCRLTLRLCARARATAAVIHRTAASARRVPAAEVAVVAAPRLLPAAMVEAVAAAIAVAAAVATEAVSGFHSSLVQPGWDTCCRRAFF